MNAWLETRMGLRLLDPSCLWLAVLIPAALIARHLRQAPAIPFGPAMFFDPSSSWRARLAPLPRALQVAGLSFVVFALARPVERHRAPLETEGIDILLCLDVSSSMAASEASVAADVSSNVSPNGSPNRLELAKAAAIEFIASRTQDRIGLVRFSRYSDVVCPLTLDHNALRQLLLSLEVVPPRSQEDGTGIGLAAARAARLLAPSQSAARIVVLLTDGEETLAATPAPDEITPKQAAALCVHQGVRVYTIAVLDETDGDPLADPIDTQPVQTLAHETGGSFFEVRDATALPSVYAAIDRLEKGPLLKPRFEIEDRFLDYFAIGFLLLAVAQLLRATILEVRP